MTTPSGSDGRKLRLRSLQDVKSRSRRSGSGASWPASGAGSGPHYEDGYIVLGYHEAHSRYLAAWSEWIDANGVDLMAWFDRYEHFR